MLTNFLFNITGWISLPDCVYFPSFAIKYDLCFMLWHLMTSWHLHSWQRVPKPHISCRPPPYIAYPLFKFCRTPTCLQPPSQLLAYFFDWVGDCVAFHVLFYLMILWIYTYWALGGTLVQEGPCCLFYPTRCQVYWSLMYNLVWCHRGTQTKKHSTVRGQ